jgi:hypothetical protein
LAGVFVGGLAAALVFFSCIFKKYKCCRVSATKTMTKKVEGNTAKQPAFGAACRASWRGLGMFSGKRILFSSNGFYSKLKTPINDWSF